MAATMVVLMTAVSVMACTTVMVDCARVLAVFPYNGHSHFTMVEPLLVALSNRGHHVTVISPFPRSRDADVGDRYVDVDVSDALPPVISQLNVTEEIGSVNPVTGLRNLCQMNHRVCETTFEHPRIRPLIQPHDTSPRFDVVLTEAFSTDCFAAFAHVYNAPLVSIRTCVSSPQLNQHVANPQNPSYLVNHLLVYAGHRMSFVQRLVNTLATYFGAVGYHAFTNGPDTELVRRHFGPDTPSVSDIVRQRTTLILVNSHHSLTQSRPLVPNMIEVGGLHIKAVVKNTTNEWLDYCDSCDQGVVYVSFGSLLKGSSFSDDFLASFVRAFEALPYCVLWKYEGEIKSKRVKTSKWMPQQLILGNKNVKVFITHGGLMGVMEAVNFGVPMIGIPVFGDQQSNIATCVEKGVAIGLDYRQMTEQKLIKSIQAIDADGSKYKLNILELSSKFRDRSMSALETAVFWTEYVIRHGNTNNFASPAIHLNFYQYFLLDIFVIILLIFLSSIYLMDQIKKLIK